MNVESIPIVRPPTKRHVDTSHLFSTNLYLLRTNNCSELYNSMRIMNITVEGDVNYSSGEFIVPGELEESINNLIHGLKNMGDFIYERLIDEEVLLVCPLRNGYVLGETISYFVAKKAINENEINLARRLKIYYDYLPGTFVPAQKTEILSERINALKFIYGNENIYLTDIVLHGTAITHTVKIFLEQEIKPNLILLQDNSIQINELFNKTMKGLELNLFFEYLDGKIESDPELIGIDYLTGEGYSHFFLPTKMHFTDRAFINYVSEKVVED